jgi:hypothetical protein
LLKLILLGVFFYNSKKFLETGESGRRLAGNGPIIVDKEDGSIHPFGTAKRPEEYIKEYGKRRGGESHIGQRRD